MTVREINGAPEAEGLQPRQTEQKKPPQSAPARAERERGAADRVEISGEARSLLSSGPNDVHGDRERRLSLLDDRLIRRILGEVDAEEEPRADKLEEVRQRLREAHYENPEVLWETARRLIDEIFGAR
ncbi:MAG: hypothetical protein QHJ34_03620 [bacterium]|jgi:hypothetical protein|nr:hypothetical protein [candidate division KSB1 bacterium]MDH7559303.1 hypothetical protein [bacterium]